MKEIDILFFDLIRIAIGNQDNLTRLPSTSEWGELYRMAQKQSLIGVCFTGIKKLVAKADGGCVEIGISKILYLNWMGIASKIQQKNVTVNAQCVKVTNIFRRGGFDVVVLKGQSCARRYQVIGKRLSDNPNNISSKQEARDLSHLRQIGDIDIWLTGSREQINKYIKEKYDVGRVIYNHAHVNVFDNTEVEVHFMPSWLYSPFHNHRLQKWFNKYKCSNVSRFNFEEKDGFKSPSVDFDLVYLMLHNYRHLMHEGLGLRQVMDYYFTLTTRPINDNTSIGSAQAVNDIDDLKFTLKQIGLLKFSGAIMYVMQVVFNLDEIDMICEPDESRGKRLLSEIMLGGNMGKCDNRTRRSTTRMGFFFEHVIRQWSFIRDYPSEVLWSPIWKTWHFVMRKTGRI